MAEVEQKTVLLVDDEKLVRLTIAMWLKGTDFTLTAVATSAEATDMIRQHRFDAVITDVMMDGMDGFMFRDFVRTVNRDIPVIFLTSLVNDADNLFMRKVMSDFNSYYVPKDSPREYLVGKLEQVVRAYRAEARLANVDRDLEKSLTLARVIQMSMMPNWEHIAPTYYYGTLWRPMEIVSGDTCYWHSLGDDSYISILGDVSGHGISAALAMAAILSYLKHFDTYTEARARDVRTVAEKIDRFIYGNLNGVAYMASTIVYFNAREHKVTYLNAGNHDLIGFRTDTGEEIILNPENRGCPPLGLIPDAVIREEDVVTAEVPDDAVFFFLSDGMTDMSSDEVGDDRPPMSLIKEIASELVRDKRHSPCILPHAIYAMLEKLGYNRTHDDVTLTAFGINRDRDDVLGLDVRMNPVEIDEAAQRLGAFVRRVFPVDGAELAVKAELLLEEHLMNVHDHGLNDYERPRERAVVQAYFEQDYLVLTMWDRGRLRLGTGDIRARADQKLDAQNEALDPHGRGEAIVRKLAVRLSRQRMLNLNQSIYYLALPGKNSEGSSHEI